MVRIECHFVDILNTGFHNLSQQGEFIGKIPFMHVAINHHQQISIAGIDHSDYGGVNEIMDKPGFKSTLLGKLNSLEPDLSYCLKRSMVDDGWNFELWPNPECILIEEA